ncbi:protein FAM204A [Tiliqua scincoides]|uniref:protein FAM204A n=1 Tax=Tiliqua scincoides TaxID=71010 RepID=UPI003463713A
MWSGLLPPGVNESDVDISSSDEETPNSPVSTLKAKSKNKHFKVIQPSDSDVQRHESIIECKPASSVAADEVQECQACPFGVSLDTWNKFQNLQKKNIEMKVQANQRDRRHKRKRSRKAKLNKDNEEIIKSQQSTKESQLKELTQYFGINDRFKPLASKEAPPKSGLEISIDRAVAEGDIVQAEELSDRLATRELGVKIASAVACRNFVKAKQEAEASQESQKKKKLAWGFEAKKRWETKSNMGYM